MSEGKKTKGGVLKVFFPAKLHSLNVKKRRRYIGNGGRGSEKRRGEKDMNHRHRKKRGGLTCPSECYYTEKEGRDAKMGP